MTETTSGTAEEQFMKQDDFEKITKIVNSEFQTEEGLLLHNIPTYYLKQPQETKEPFLRLLKSLESISMIAFLRKVDGRIVLRIVPKPLTKPSDIRVNWALFFATIVTTFVTGYMLSSEFVTRGIMASPYVGALAFTVTIMTVLGMHEMGHKLTANRRHMEATSPYFIPGLPPNLGGFGTFGAVIMQKSLPPNRDALFDVGSSGPITSFILAIPASLIGLLLSPKYPISGKEGGFLPVPLIFELFINYIVKLPSNYYVLAHPVALAGWVGIIVTMLNLLPSGMLDGGHVARSIFGEKPALALTILSVAYLFIEGFYPMAILVLLMSTFKHPGPLDEVSSISRSRKLLAIGLLAIFILCIFPQFPTL